MSKQNSNVLGVTGHTKHRRRDLGPEMVSLGPKGAQSKQWKMQPLARKGDSVQPGILPFFEMLHEFYQGLFLPLGVMTGPA